MFKQINKTRIDVKSESGIFYVFPQWEVIDPEKQAISEQRQTVSLWSHYVGRIALLPAGKPYLMGLVFTHKNGDFGSVSVTEPIFKLERHRSDRFCARLWCSVNRKRSRSSSDDYREIKIHVYAKRQTWICTTWSSFPFTFRLLLLLLQKNK